MDYSEAFAFVEQVEYRYTHDKTWAEFFLSMAKRNMELQELEGNAFDSASDFVRLILTSLWESKMYFASRETLDLIEAGQRSMRKIVLEDAESESRWEGDTYRPPERPLIAYWTKDTFSGPGFLYFERGAGPAFHFNIPEKGSMKVVFTGMDAASGRAGPCKDHDDNCGIGYSRAVQWTRLSGFLDDTTGLKWTAVIMYGDVPGFRIYGVPLGVYAWGENMDHAIHFASGKIDWDSPTFLSSFWAFIEQRILVTESNAPPKAFRKRMEREKGKVKPIQVVQLRRREYKIVPPPSSTALASDGSGANGLDDVAARRADWSCRWMVDAHWHRYHTNGGLVRKWLLPYQKGPENKPLVIPKNKVFAVVR